MTKFAFDNKVVRLHDVIPRIEDELPVDTYALKADMTGIYLEAIDDFAMPKTLYGNVNTQADRIISTFDDRGGVTGLLLTGEKGSGKTLLGKLVATRLKNERQMPIIVVNIPISGDDFSIFLQKINRPVVLFFDEFEKVYGREEFQNGLLTLLDGVYPLKMMAILTSNDDSRLIGPLLDRPGRIYYKLDYQGLDYDFIMQYAEKNLKNHDHLVELSRLAALTQMNFDQMQALIEEMNRYDESVSDAVQMLNISMTQPAFGMRIDSFSANGKKVPVADLSDTYYDGNLTFSDDNPLTIHYKMENVSKLSFQQILSNIDDEDLRYEIQSVWSHKFRPGPGKNYNEEAPFIPAQATFDSHTHLEVSRDGKIKLTNRNGNELVLVRPPRYTRKEF